MRDFASTAISFRSSLYTTTIQDGDGPAFFDTFHTVGHQLVLNFVQMVFKMVVAQVFYVPTVHMFTLMHEKQVNNPALPPNIQLQIVKFPLQLPSNGIGTVGAGSR